MPEGWIMSDKMKPEIIVFNNKTNRTAGSLHEDQELPKHLEFTGCDNKKSLNEWLDNRAKGLLKESGIEVKDAEKLMIAISLLAQKQ